MSKSAKSIPASEKAWSVGAKTVNGPGPCRVGTKPTCERAATREVWTPVLPAFVGISSVGPALALRGRLDASSSVIIKYTIVFLIDGVKKPIGYNGMFSRR